MLWTESARYFHRNELRGRSHREIFESGAHLGPLRETIERCGSTLSTDYGPLMFKGMLASGHDRAAAAELFAAARDTNPEFASALALDHFAVTYFAQEEIAHRATDIAAQRAGLLEDFELLSEPTRKREDEMSLLFSSDPVFLAIYFPYWASIAHYLNYLGVSLHIIVVGEDREATAAIDRALDVAHAMARLRGFDPKKVDEVVSFSKVTVPPWVENEKSFYACARFLCARELAARLQPRLLILDIDMVMTERPEPFLRAHAAAHDAYLPFPTARGLCTLIPARRYGAGCFLVPTGELGAEAMRHVEDYMFTGLMQRDSWTLDQNALAYTVERLVAARGPDVIRNMDTPRRPFAQEHVRQLFESVQRKQDESSQ